MGSSPEKLPEMSYLHVPFDREDYQRRSTKFPLKGKHLICCFNEKFVILYLSCPQKAAIAVTAFQNFSKLRKLKAPIQWTLTPSYHGVIRRSEWASLEGHRHILALAVSRKHFEEILAIKNDEEIGLSWTQEFDPFGNPLERETLQIEVKGPFLKKFTEEMILRIWDVTGFVRKQRYTLHVIGTEWIYLLLDWMPPGIYITFQVPREELYFTEEVKKALELDTTEEMLPKIEDKSEKILAKG